MWWIDSTSSAALSAPCLHKLSCMQSGMCVIFADASLQHMHPGRLATSSHCRLHCTSSSIQPATNSESVSSKACKVESLHQLMQACKVVGLLGKLWSSCLLRMSHKCPGPVSGKDLSMLFLGMMLSRSYSPGHVPLVLTQVSNCWSFLSAQVHT